MTRPVLASIALGSNLSSDQGDRSSHIQYAVQAIAALPSTRLIAVSDMFETDPVGPAEQGRYFNAALVIETLLAPSVLLARLLEIEQARGRDRSREQRWGPRTLDLDILLYGDNVIDLPSLTIPHPRMHERRFVLEPLAQIAPDAVLPTFGRTVRDLRDSLRGHGERT